MLENSTNKVIKNHPILFYCGSGGSSKYDLIAIKHGWKPEIGQTLKVSIDSTSNHTPKKS